MSPAARWAVGAGAVAAVVLLITLIASIGGPHTAWEGLAAVLYALVRAGGPAAAYLAAGVGLGRLLRPLFAGTREPLVLQAGLGVALMLTVSHLLGVSGVLRGTVGMVIADGIVGAGLILLAKQVADASQDGSARVRIPLAAAAAVPAIALLVVAAANPPGWLWESEARGYDVLEYHLQLPQEWLALGRIRPLEHNVYSFLPGYVESAFYFLAVMMGSPAAPTPGSQAMGLLAGDGMGVLSAQYLHAGIGLLGAWAIARLVVAARRTVTGNDDDGSVVAGSLAGAAYLSVPWTLVAGSSAYNDLGVVLLTACALIAAIDTGAAPARRGVMVGILIGAACGVKPTALLMGALPAGIVLAGMPGAVRAIAWAAGAGLTMLLPWLVRNWIACGNPVFPEMTAILGKGHWSAEQVSRYAAAHRFDGSLLERLRLIVAPSTDPGSGGTTRRGVLNEQWSIFFPLVVAAMAVVLGWRRSRVGLLLGAGLLAQLVAWLFATHIQARFLLPLAAPGAAAIGLSLLTLRERSAVVWRCAATGVAACTLFMAWRSGAIFAAQGSVGPDVVNRPNALLIGGPPAKTGEDMRAGLESKQPLERASLLTDLNPLLRANLTLPPGSKVYLLGDSTPLYYTVPVVYCTTFDRSLLAEAMSRTTDRTDSWTGALRRAGVTHVVASLPELERLQRSKFLDPDLKPERIAAWLQLDTRMVQAWPSRGPALVVLVELPKGGRGNEP